MNRVFAIYQLTHGSEGPQGLADALRSATTIPAMEPGCRSSSIWLEAGTSGAVLLMEEWESPQAMERHMASPTFRRLLAVLELSRTPPEIRYVQGSRLRGVDWITQVLGPPAGESGKSPELQER
jgi:quinol monooxygenase YgiN